MGGHLVLGSDHKTSGRNQQATVYPFTVKVAYVILPPLSGGIQPSMALTQVER